MATQRRARVRTLEELLAGARAGDAQAVRELLALLYDDLHRIARARMRSHDGLTLLDTTAVLHESMIRLVGARTLAVEDRGHFLAYASKVMRSVVVDYVRGRAAERRAGAYERVTLTTASWQDLAAPETDAMHVSEALETLERADPRLAQVIEMRFFGGLTEPEIAEAVGINERTVRRDLVKARLLLKEMLA